MSSVIAAAIGIWLMFLLVFTTLVGAQQGPVVPTKALLASSEIGDIKGVDPAGNTVLTR